MKSIKNIILFNCFILITLPAISQTNQDTSIIQFFSPTIIDTVDETNIKLKYYFVFKNVSNEFLIIENAQGSDPDFPFYYPQMPIKPGGIDSIGVVLVPQQLKIPNLTRHYVVHYNKNQKINLCLRRRILR